MFTFLFYFYGWWVGCGGAVEGKSNFLQVIGTDNEVHLQTCHKNLDKDLLTLEKSLEWFSIECRKTKTRVI